MSHSEDAIRWLSPRRDPGSSSPPPGDPEPGGATASVEPTGRWGLASFVVVWLAGLAGATLTMGFFAAAVGTSGEPPALVLFGLVLPAQQVFILGALVAVSRSHGHGSLRQAFGLELRAGHASAVLAGVALQVALSVVVAPVVRWLGDGTAPQEIVRSVAGVGGAAASVAMVASVGVLAPLVEELLYRGLLLRALLQRVPTRQAILISGAVFGSVHLLDTGFRPEAIPVVLAVGVLGVVLAALAVRDGSLSRPIFVHMGFNLAVVVAAVAT